MGRHAIAGTGKRCCFIYQVGFDAQGNGFSAWVQNTNLYVSRYENGQWNTPEVLEGTSPNVYSSYPELKVSDSGHAVIAWVQGDIFINRYIPGKGVESVGSASAAYYPKVGIDNAGNVTVAWTQRYADATTDLHVHVNRYEVGSGGWQGVEPLEEITTGSAYGAYMQVARDEAGNSMEKQVLI